MKVKIKKYPDLYNKNTFEINPGVTYIIGKNGIGKSTFLNKIKKDYLEPNNIPFFEYCNYKEGGKDARSKYGFHGNMKMLAITMSSSEGQQIMVNFGETLTNIGHFVGKCIKENKKDVFVLLDALDSGLSIDNIEEVKSIFAMILDHAKKDDMNLYILATANTYSLVENEKCLDVKQGKIITFTNYEEYKRFILRQKDTEKQ